MPYQAGTATNFGDLLDNFHTFLSGAGWTIDAFYREAMQYSTSLDGMGNTISHWRYGRVLAAHKGNKYVIMQDFYITPDLSYGTEPSGTFKIGPGVALIAGTGNGSAGQLGDETTKPTSWYSMPNTMDGGGPIIIPAWTSGVANPAASTLPLVRTVIMPCAALASAGGGTWSTADRVMVHDGVLAEPFVTPMPYWFMADASGDNVIMVVQRPLIAGDGVIPLTPYLCFGDLVKAGTWTGTGVYFGASHGRDKAFQNVSDHRIFRFGPPGAVMDDLTCTFLVKADVDTSVGIWPAVCNVAPAPGTGRRLSSTAVMPNYNGSGPAGVQGGNVQFKTLVGRQSSLRGAAPLLPVYLVAERDNLQWSVLGVLPEIWQANTFGIVPGTVTQAANGDSIVIFDGFAVRQHV